MANTQERLSEVDRLQLAIVTLKQENAQLRQELAATEARVFEMQLHRNYGNPGERIQVQADGSLLRIPPPAETP
jgi:cell division protein FtsB